jgi:Uma2 family endonuclease
MVTQLLEKTVEQEQKIAPASPLTLDMMMQAAEIGIRLEYIAGVGGIWETMPLKRHQGHIYRIQTSIKAAVTSDGHRSGCGCFHYSDLSMRFPDGSAKRPDIAIFCTDPEQEDEEVTVLPDAVIELVSPGYADKDYNVAVPFYKRMGIADIVIFDPLANDVLHINAAGETHHTSPVTLTFACGCTCVV